MSRRLWLPKDSPPLPEGYHYSNVASSDVGTFYDVSFRGARIFIIAIEMNHREVQMRYTACPVRNVFEWIEYPDLPTLVTAMITKHRLGVI